MAKGEWVTTNQNPLTHGHLNSEPTGWRLHYVPDDVDEYPHAPAICGVVPKYGWGMDMFIIDKCKRCAAAVEKGQKDDA